MLWTYPCNLHTVSFACAVRATKVNSTSYRGVKPVRKGKFAARIGGEGFGRWLGTFDTAGEAALAYDRQARKKYGKIAICNFP
jgi:hypothetical protein